MRRYKNNFATYVSKVLKDRLKELDCSVYRFVLYNSDIASMHTMQRVFRGEGNTNIMTLAHICEKLGLEITIKPKADGVNYKQKLAR